MHQAPSTLPTPIKAKWLFLGVCSKKDAPSSLLHHNELGDRVEVRLFKMQEPIRHDASVSVVVTVLRVVAVMVVTSAHHWHKEHLQHQPPQSVDQRHQAVTRQHLLQRPVFYFVQCSLHGPDTTEKRQHPQKTLCATSTTPTANFASVLAENN
ncbi:hypothetical protein O3P69_020780 [Scylla paramamosain]|uniref:Uncharacterized protein n=1 Tax=Scylla paramamosain TaxID=85552 RepID=A0AAW0TPP5_SCYPA